MGSLYSMEMLDKGMIHILGRSEGDGGGGGEILLRHSELFISGAFHLIFLDHSWARITETTDKVWRETATLLRHLKLKYKFWLCRFGWSPGVCISDKLPGNDDAAGLQNTHLGSKPLKDNTWEEDLIYLGVRGSLCLSFGGFLVS